MRLIEAEDLIEHAEVNCESKDFIRKLMDYVADAPTIEPEIIRCKNCVYGKPVEGDEEHRVDCAHGIIGWEETNIHGVNWFCADAEREENA